MAMPLNYYHRQVCVWLSELGISYVEEYPVGRYSLDIYLPDMRRGVEIDGPGHNKKRDRQRDLTIVADETVDELVRIKVGTRKAKALKVMLE